MTFFSFFSRKSLPPSQEVPTEKILFLLDDLKHLTAALAGIHNLETLLRKLHMALDPRVQAALDSAKQKITDAISNEIQDVKDLVNSGASTDEIVAALDDFGDNVSTSIDDISVAAGGTPPTPPGE